MGRANIPGHVPSGLVVDFDYKAVTTGASDPYAGFLELERSSSLSFELELASAPDSALKSHVEPASAGIYTSMRETRSWGGNDQYLFNLPVELENTKKHLYMFNA